MMERHWVSVKANNIVSMNIFVTIFAIIPMASLFVALAIFAGDLSAAKIAVVVSMGFFAIASMAGVVIPDELHPVWEEGDLNTVESFEAWLHGE